MPSVISSGPRGPGHRAGRCAQASLGRLSGDEFAVLLADCTDGEVRSLAAAIGQAVARPFAPTDGVSIETVASIGIAMSPEDADDASRLLHLATRPCTS